VDIGGIGQNIGILRGRSAGGCSPPGGSSVSIANDRAAGNAKEPAMLEEMLGQGVVVDLRSPFVCLGTLQRVDAEHLELRNADFHDLRDSESTRESYVSMALASGIKRNRKRVLLSRSEVVAIALLNDVTDE
jgi:hypothetical protein